MDDLTSTLEELQKKERTTTDVVDEATKRNMEIKVICNRAHGINGKIKKIYIFSRKN